MHASFRLRQIHTWYNDIRLHLLFCCSSWKKNRISIKGESSKRTTSQQRLHLTWQEECFSPCSKASPNLKDSRLVVTWFLKQESKWTRRWYSPPIRTKTDPRKCHPSLLQPEKDRCSLVCYLRWVGYQVDWPQPLIALCEEIRKRHPTKIIKYIVKISLTVFFVVSWTTAFLKFSLLSEPPIPTTKFSLLFFFVTV